MKSTIKNITVLVCTSVLLNGAMAGPLTYTPVNPDFGGNPNNAAGLMASAQATNKHTASADSNSLLNQTPLEQFNQTLEQTVLSQLASAATTKLVGANGQLVPGTFSTGTFSITVVNAGNGILTVTTVDKTTGASTTFQVSQ